MKNLQISHTIYPDDWIPKPPTTAYNFLDWATNWFYWQCMIYKIPVDNQALIRAELRGGLK